MSLNEERSSNKKRLICFSIINNEFCSYYDKCTYAHSLAEQIIDTDKYAIYCIVLDETLMEVAKRDNLAAVYKQLIFMTSICEACLDKKCTGGYNCKNGVHDTSLKICKSDLLTGQCFNNVIDIEISAGILDKITDITKPTSYKGCINGHHLTSRNLTPYFKYIHQIDYQKRNNYQSTRCIDIEQVYKFMKISDYDIYDKDESSESTDSEINSWFQRDNLSDSDDTLCSQQVLE